MKDEVARLAYRRSVVAERKALLVEAEAKLHASPLWQQVGDRRESLNRAKSRQTDAEVAVRQEAMKVFTETGDKTPHPAVKVKMYTALDYDDGDALDYARVYVPRAVKLDKRAFEKAAKVLEPDFVTIWQEPRITIARDLNEYLPKSNDGSKRI